MFLPFLGLTSTLCAQRLDVDDVGGESRQSGQPCSHASGTLLDTIEVPYEGRQNHVAYGHVNLVRISFK